MSNRKGPPQTSRPAESGASYDQCWTPWHGVAPLLPFLPAGARIWEPCAGAGWLARWLEEAGHVVICTEYTQGVDFLNPSHAIDPDSYDVIVTNPPYTLKYAMMRRCYELGKPWALLVPQNTVAADSAAKLADEYRLWEELRLRQRINFHMPDTGFRNNGAQFTTWWLCSGLLPQQVLYVHLPAPRPEHRLIKPPKKAPKEQLTMDFLEAA